MDEPAFSIWIKGFRPLIRKERREREEEEQEEAEEEEEEERT